MPATNCTAWTTPWALLPPAASEQGFFVPHVWETAVSSGGDAKTNQKHKVEMTPKSRTICEPTELNWEHEPVSVHSLIYIAHTLRPGS